MAYSGRIYLAAGRYVWPTERFLYDFVDKSKNFLQFEHDITMMASLVNGMFIGTTESVVYLEGVYGTGMSLKERLDVGVIPGSMVRLPAFEIHPDARSGPYGDTPAIAFMTRRGICAAFQDGSILQITQGRVEFPTAQSAAALYREDSGGRSYVAVTDAAGGPAANARIGDYVDAEIVRQGS